MGGNLQHGHLAHILLTITIIKKLVCLHSTQGTIDLSAYKCYKLVRTPHLHKLLYDAHSTRRQLLREPLGLLRLEVGALQLRDELNADRGWLRLRHDLPHTLALRPDNSMHVVVGCAGGGWVGMARVGEHTCVVLQQLGADADCEPEVKYGDSGDWHKRACFKQGCMCQMTIASIVGPPSLNARLLPLRLHVSTCC